MKLKVYDNPKTKCRELWINDQIIHAINVQDYESFPKAPRNLFEATIAIGKWAPNRIHMETNE